LKSKRYNIQAIKGLGYVSLLLATIGIIVSLIDSTSQNSDLIAYIGLIILGSALNIVANELAELRK